MRGGSAGVDLHAVIADESPPQPVEQQQLHGDREGQVPEQATVVHDLTFIKTRAVRQAARNLFPIKYLALTLARGGCARPGFGCQTGSVLAASRQQGLTRQGRRRDALLIAKSPSGIMRGQTHLIGDVEFTCEGASIRNRQVMTGLQPPSNTSMTGERS